jgi:hypothetical protein
MVRRVVTPVLKAVANSLHMNPKRVFRVLLFLAGLGLSVSVREPALRVSETGHRNNAVV